VSEKVIKMKAALQAALAAIDLRIHLDDGFGVGNSCFHRLRRLSSLIEAE